MSGQNKNLIRSLRLFANQLISTTSDGKFGRRLRTGFRAEGVDIQAKPIGNDIRHVTDLLGRPFGSIVPTSRGVLIEHDDVGVEVDVEWGRLEFARHDQGETPIEFDGSSHAAGFQAAAAM